MKDNNTILMIDDDKNMCRIVSLYLEKEGFTVETVNDGAEGLKRFLELQPEMVLLDIMLPSMDGWQICREIRANSDVPIIMLTAKGEVFDKILGLELGAVHMADAAAPLALEQKAVPVAVALVAAVLVQGALLRVDLVDGPGGLQLLQLAVDGGKAHRAARPAQVLRQLRGGAGVLAPGLQAAEHCLVLFCTVGHLYASRN